MMKLSTRHPGCLPFRAVVLAATTLLLSLATGCAQVSKADFAGYIKDKATGAGIVGATVKLHLSDPTGNANAVPYAQTTTAYNSSLPGYYSYKLIWSSTTPAFQDQGDLATVWVVASHPDYPAGTATKVTGVVSGAQNTAPDVLLVRTGFSALVSGTVQTDVDPTATVTLMGVNGVRVGLQLDSTAGTESDDYVAATAAYTVGSTTTQGVFSFAAPIKWENTAALNGTDAKTVKIWLSWPAISVPATIAAGSKSFTVTIPSGTTVSTIGPFVIP